MRALRGWQTTPEERITGSKTKRRGNTRAPHERRGTGGHYAHGLERTHPNKALDPPAAGEEILIAAAGQRKR